MGKGTSRPSHVAVACLGALTLVSGLTACSSTPKASAADTKRITVATSVYAITQLVQLVGTGHVEVEELSPPGTDPRSLTLTSATASKIEGASIVIDVGDGYQPAIEAAVAKAPRHLDLLSALGESSTEGYDFWLDPATMINAASVVAGTLSAADPADASAFKAGANTVRSLASSLDVDFRNSLSDCTKHTIVTADSAFEPLAAHYGFTDEPLSTSSSDSSPLVSPARIEQVAALMHAQNLGVILKEVGEPAGPVEEVAAVSGATVDSIDPLDTVQSGLSPVASSYFNMMETNLNPLENALGCDSVGEGP